MNTIDTQPAVAALVDKHKLHLSTLVQRIHGSEDPEFAWRFECSVHEPWRSDEPLIKANGFGRNEAEARRKAEAWQLREVQIDGFDVLISSGDDLLRTQACIPSLKLTIIEGRGGWTWRMPASDLVPALAPMLHGLYVDWHDTGGPALRGDYSDPLCSRPAPEESITGVLADARKQISASVAAARSFAARMDKFLPNS